MRVPLCSLTTAINVFLLIQNLTVLSVTNAFTGTKCSSRKINSRTPRNLLSVVSSSPLSRSPLSRSPLSRSPLSRSPLSRSPLSRSPLRRSPMFTINEAVDPNSPASLVETHDVDVEMQKKKRRDEMEKLRKEGGVFSFRTPLGALNLYGIYYTLTAVLIGFYWYTATTLWRFVHFLSRKKFDSKHFIPVLISHSWGRLTMKLTFQEPKFENCNILKEFYKTKRAAMFVANHCSWQDIPYLGSTIGWRNYKMVAKQELLKVPILGGSIKAGGHVIVDRSSRKSQLMTLKKGIKCLKDGMHLCTFPEGTRSKDGRLLKFRNGAFKMAYKAGAPVIPVSIVHASTVQPKNWVMPNRTAKDVKVVVHEPIESEGKTEEELAKQVREAIISGLPEDQRPLND